MELLKKYYQYLEKLGYENNEQNLAKGLQVMKEVYESGQSVVIDAETAIWNSTQWYWYLDMEFAENGILPCEVTIRIKPEYAYRGYFNEEMNLVYVDGENYTYLTEGIKLGVDDYFTFKVSHNSEYWLINDNMKKQMIKMAQKQENENKPEEPEQVVDKDKKPNQDNEEKDEADKIIDDEPDTGITSNEMLYVSIMACISLISIKKVINKGRKER